MSGVVIEGGWAPAPGGGIGRRDGTVAAWSLPPFSHPAYGYPDFVVSAKRRRSARRRIRRRLLVGAVAGALLVGGTWVLVSNEVGTHRALAQTRTALSHTREQLSKTASERDNYQAQLAQAETQLAQAQRNLSSAQNQVSLEGSQIAVLKTCLAGVLRSLDYAASNDYGSAVSTIDVVAGSCNAASSLLGSTAPAAASPVTSPPAATVTT